MFGRYAKVDVPELAARARELRDRWMDATARGEWVLLPAGKYDVNRSLPDSAANAALDFDVATPALPSAASIARVEGLRRLPAA